MNIMKASLLFCCVLIITTIGCGMRIPLNSKDQNILKPGRIFINIPQNSLQPAYSNYTVAGAVIGPLPLLIGAIADSSNRTSAKRWVQPVLDQLADYDYRQAFKHKLESGPFQFNWLNSSSIHFERGGPLLVNGGHFLEEAIQKRIEESDSIVILYEIQYLTTINLDGINAHSRVSVYKPGVTYYKSNELRPLYFNNFTCSIPFQGLPGDNTCQQNSVLLLKNIQLVKDALDRSQDHLISMLDYDIQRLRGDKKEPMVQITKDGPKIRLAKRSGEFVYVRDMEDRLCAFKPIPHKIDGNMP